MRSHITVEQLEDRLVASIDLSGWKLTLPIGAPTEINPPALLSYDSIYFHKQGSAEVFWCPVNGSHTQHSSYPRTELRELNRDGSLAAWRVQDGTATMAATLAVNQLPSNGKVVVGQIHFSSNPLIKLLYDPNNGGQLRALVRDKPDGDSKSYTLATGIPLDQLFSYKVYTKVTPAGNYELRVQVNGVTKLVKRLDPVWASERYYFKAGDYVQDNIGPSTEGGRVTFYSLTVKHT